VSVKVSESVELFESERFDQDVPNGLTGLIARVASDWSLRWCHL